MSHIPNGIPTISYCRILPTVGSFGQGDIVNDGNAVVVLEPGQPSSRFEVAQVIEKNFDDEEACEMTFGNKAGGGLGAVLNPVSAFVNDAANVVVFLVGSRNTRKWHFLKRIFLPFIANEILGNLSDRSQLAQNNMYKAQLTISALEMQDEVITDLLRPANRGLSITTNIEEGVIVQGLHRETVVDEMALRRLLIESCDNRGIQNLPVGGNIDTSTGIFEFRLYQSEVGGQNNANGNNNPPVFQTRECNSRLIIVDLPAVDPLLSTFNSSSSEEMRLFAGTTLHKSLFTFMEVSKKLNNPFRAQLAPFRSSKLTYYLSELIGGNAIVVSFGNIISGEPTITKITLELMSYLNNALHYPLSGREISDTVHGLLTKYRSMLIYSQNELLLNNQNINDNQQQSKELQNQIVNLQKEVATAIIDKNTAIEDRMKIMEILELMKKKYQTILDEKLKQSELLSDKEEENILLAKTILEKNLEMVTKTENYENQLHEKSSEIIKLETLLENKENMIKSLNDEKNILLKEIEFNKEICNEKNNEINLLKIENLNKMKEIAELKEKNIEISAELLTLVNTKEVLMKEKEEFQIEKDSFNIKKNEMIEKISSLETETKKLLEKLLAKEEELLEMKKSMQMDFLKEQELKELKAAQAEAAEKKLKEAEEDAKKSEGNKDKDKKKRKESNKDEVDADEEALKGSSSALSLGGGGDIAKRMIQAMRLSVEEKKEKLLSKQLYEWETKYNRLLYDFQALKNSSDQSNQELNDLREKYSQKLKENIENSNSVSVTNNNNNNNSAEQNNNPLNNTLTNLLQHYEKIIDNLLQKTDFYVSNNHEIIQHYRDLYDHYHTTVDNLEEIFHLFQDYAQTVSLNANSRNNNNSNSNNSSDKAARVMEKKMLVETKLKMILENALKEQFQLSHAKVTQEELWLDDTLAQEKLNEAASKEDQKKQQIEEKEKIAAIINTYQRNLQSAEQKNVKLHQDNINYQIQIQQLLTKQQQLQKENELHKEKKDKEKEEDGKPPASPAQPETESNHLLQLQLQQQQQQLERERRELQEKNQMYENLTSEIRELKSLFMQHEANNKDGKEKDGKGSLVNSRRPSSQLIEVLRDVMSGKNSGKMTPQPPPLSEGQKSGRSTAKSIKSLTSAGNNNNNNPEEGELGGEEDREKKQEADNPFDKQLSKDNILSLPAIPSASPAPLKGSTSNERLNSSPEKSVPVPQPAPAAAPAQPTQDQIILKRQLIDAEQKIVQLTSKQMSMEEELKSYQTYMRDVIPQYQKQIKVLQQKYKQLQQASSVQAGPAAETKDGVKLPVLKLP